MRAPGLALAAGLALAGCGEPEAPRLNALRFDGQARDSSTVLLFTLDFEDDEGDLGRGRLETFINRRASGLGALALEPIFLWNEVPLDATEGSLEMVLELSLANEPQGGDEFELGVRAIDSLGHVSEPRSVRLAIEAR